MRCLLKICGALMLLLLCENMVVDAQRLPFYNLSIEQGLIQSQATCLAQDGTGHLWIGTLGGLSRWDGHQFVNYTLRDGLPSNTIFAIKKVGRDLLAIGTTKGLSIYDGHTFRNFTFTPADDPRGNTVAAIEPADGMIWCIAGGKLYRINHNRIFAVALPDADARCTSLLYGRNNTLWVGCAETGKYYNYRNGEWLPTMDLKGGAKTVFSFFEDTAQAHESFYGVLTDKGLQACEYGTPSDRFKAEMPLAQQLINGTQAGPGGFWFSASSGAYHYSNGKYTAYGRRDGLTDNRINDILKDREGNIWFASDGQGIFRYSGAPFTILDEASGLGSAQISAFAAAPDGSLFLGTYEAGIYQFKGGKVMPTRFPKDFAVGEMTTAMGKVWAGTRANGLFYLDGNTWKPFTSLPFKAIGSLYTDPYDRLWIGGARTAALLTKDSLQTIGGKNDAVSDFITIGRDSTLIATAGGLQLYSGRVESAFLTRGLTDSATIQCMAKSGYTLYFGTSDNGIIVYDRRSRKSLSIGKAQGLRSDFIYNLTVDNAGDLWAGTGFGIHRIQFAKNGYSIAVYGQEAGMKGMESNHEAALKLPDGSIWFGTTDGAVHYTPSGNSLRSMPAVVISSVRLFGKPITDSSFFKGTSPYYGVPAMLRLPYRENNLTFTFNGILLSGSPLQYRYLLDGPDAQWSAWGDVPTVNFSAIPSGKYTLHVQCRSADGLVGSAAPYAFEIITPFHRTGLFRVLIVVACILLGIALQYYAARRRLARERLIEKLRREEQAIIRERTAEDFHDEVGNKITRINVLASVLKGKLGKPPEDVLRIIGSIQDNAGQLYQGTRDILWSLKPSNDSVYEIVTRIIHFGQDLFGDTDVHFTAMGLDESWKSLRLQMDASRNLIMIFKEALNNVLKHSGATAVSLEAALDKDLLTLELTDNGNGFLSQEVQRGHGLDNMQNRAKRLNGHLDISSTPGAGTTFTLKAKIPLMKG